MDLREGLEGGIEKGVILGQIALWRGKEIWRIEKEYDNKKDELKSLEEKRYKIENIEERVLALRNLDKSLEISEGNREKENEEVEDIFRKLCELLDYTEKLENSEEIETIYKIIPKILDDYENLWLKSNEEIKIVFEEILEIVKSDDKKRNVKIKVLLKNLLSENQELWELTDDKKTEVAEVITTENLEDHLNKMVEKTIKEYEEKDSKDVKPIDVIKNMIWKEDNIEGLEELKINLEKQYEDLLKKAKTEKEREKLVNEWNETLYLMEERESEIK